METIIFLLIYLIGGILSFGRINASVEFISPIDYVITVLYIVLGWVGFISGVMVYFLYDRQQFKQFFKWRLG